MNNPAISQSNLCVGPMRSSDRDFFRRLYYSTRTDLQIINTDLELHDKIMKQQFQAFEEGINTQYPGAQHFIAEYFGSPVGAFTVDFGHNEVRLIYLALIPQVHGKGFGSTIVHGLQKAARASRAPLVVVVMSSNQAARTFYQSLGFKPQESSAMAERYVWFPDPIEV